MKTLELYKDGSTAHPEFPFGPVFQGLLVSGRTHSHVHFLPDRYQQQ